MKVMVALDESEGSFYALNWVLCNILGPMVRAGAQAEEDAAEIKLYLAHVHLPFQTYVYPAGPVVYATSSVLESVREAQANISASIFSRALKCCEEKSNVKVETVTLRGDPKEMLCQAVEERHVDLLVVGSRGLGMLKRALLGSVSDYCTHHARCPVLIVKPPKEATGQAAQVHQRKAT